MKSAGYLITAICLIATLASAQTTDERVKGAIAKLEKGQTEEAKKIAADLMAKQPNNPGVLYLQGRLATNGTEAMKDYQSIVDNFPKSEWADDALFAISQYYYSLGLYKTADLKLQQLRKEYPTSPFLANPQPAPAMNVSEDPVNLPTKTVVSVPDSPKTNAEEPAEETPGPYILQVGAYSTAANAEKQKAFFENIGMTVEITNKVRGGRSLYLVWVGGYRTTDEAKAAAKEIKQKHKTDSIVVERY
jgi:cell division septation protein DedD